MSHAPTQSAVAAGNEASDDDLSPPGLPALTRQASCVPGGGGAHPAAPSLVRVADEANALLRTRELPEGPLPCDLLEPDGLRVTVAKFVEFGAPGGAEARYVVAARDERFDEPAFCVLEREASGTLRLVGAMDASNPSLLLAALPRARPVFVEMTAECSGPSGANEVKRVVVRFASAAELETADGDGFDTVYASFNAGLPEGWVADDALGMEREVPDPDRFVVYMAD